MLFPKKSIAYKIWMNIEEVIQYINLTNKKNTLYFPEN
jgi:hypothetical protein